MSPKERIILGIDPGTTVMGYGVIRIIDRKVEFVALGAINLKAIKNHYLTYGKYSKRSIAL